jgi:hypothetical protein
MMMHAEVGFPSADNVFFRSDIRAVVYSSWRSKVTNPKEKEVYASRNRIDAAVRMNRDGNVELFGYLKQKIEVNGQCFVDISHYIDRARDRAQ